MQVTQNIDKTLMMILWHHLKNIPAVQYVIDKYISCLFFID